MSGWTKSSKEKINMQQFFHDITPCNILQLKKWNSITKLLENYNINDIFRFPSSCPYKHIYAQNLSITYHVVNCERWMASSFYYFKSSRRFRNKKIQKGVDIPLNNQLNHSITLHSPFTLFVLTKQCFVLVLTSPVHRLTLWLFNMLAIIHPVPLHHRTSRNIVG